METETILRLRDVLKIIGLGRSSIYLMMQENRFPRAVQLGIRALGWRQTEIHEWLKTRKYTSPMR